MYLYLVISTGVLLAVFTVWKEYRAETRRLAWRIVASLAAVIALLCIALPISYPGEKKLADNEAVLLTNGFSNDSLKFYKNDSLLTIDPAIKKENSKVKLLSIGQVKSLTPAVTRLHVFGYGLTPDDLKQLDSIPVVFHSGPQPVGIRSINWTDRLKQGQALKVQGIFNNTSDKLVRLTLKGLNTNADSAIIPAKGSVAFSLTDLPKNVGPSVYRIVALANTDTVLNENLPVIIEPVKPLKILLPAAAPGFENKFLKNWLTENGFSVAIRSAISKDKFSSEYVNMESLPLNSLTTSVLDKFDVVISDLSVIHVLSVGESALLKEQVTQKGLGLIVRADTTFDNKIWAERDFPIRQPSVKESRPSDLIINGKKVSAKVAGADQSFITYEDGTQLLVSDGQNRELAGLTIAGEGKIIFTTLQGSYTWMLDGDKTDYAAFWSILIGKVARPVSQARVWLTAGHIASVNSPVAIQLQTSGQVGQIDVDSTKLSPAQNDITPYQWQATWWPVTPGWHILKAGNSAPGAVYVADENAWKTIKAAEKTDATKKYAARFDGGSNVTKQIHQKSSIAVPKGYFYVLLLAACTWLWVEGKAGKQTA
jgi:hypothetical protein